MKSIKTVTISQELANAIKGVTMVDEVQNVWDNIRESRDTTLFEEVCKVGLELGSLANSMTLMYLVSTELYVVEDPVKYWVVYGQYSEEFYVRNTECISWYKQVKIKKFDNADEARACAYELNQLNVNGPLEE